MTQDISGPRKDRIKSNGLIEKQVKEEIEELSVKTGQNQAKIVEEVLKNGIKYFITTREIISRISEEKLIDDDFHYSYEQINLCGHIQANSDFEMSEIKSALMKKGIIELKSK